MVIDDDIPMLKYIKQAVNWNEIGLEVVFESSSSIQALEALSEIQPDILLTDIGIPGIDGIELARRVKKKNEQVRITFLTCHEDFSYAKKAIKLEADDYILKEELTPKVLKESLLKMISNLDQNQNSTPDNIIDRHNYARRIFVDKLQEGSEDINLCFKKMNVSWDLPDYKIIIGYLPVSNSIISDYYALLESFYKHLSDFLYENDQVEVFINNDHLICIYNYKDNIKVQIESQIKKLLEAAAGYCYSMNHTRCSFLLVKDKLNLNNLSETYRDIINHRERYFYSIPKQIQVVSVSKESAFIPLGNLIESEEYTLFKYVELKDEDNIKTCINRIKKIIYSNQIEPNDVLSALLTIVIKLELNLITDNKVDCFTKALKLCWTMEEVLAIFQDKVIQMTIEGESQLSIKNKIKGIQDIDSYIALHLSENISSIDMANHLHFNPSYFSRYFKRLTGHTFTDYSYRYKMTAACRFLVDSDQPVEEIALKVGFNERTYFTKVFKKYIGQTPGQYRKRGNN